jgi:hypothetical protein
MKTLSCGHPDSPNHLIDGKCGTCKKALEFEELASMDDGPWSKSLRAIAEMFRAGDILFDANGKTLMEWDKEFKTLPRPEL